MADNPLLSIIVASSSSIGKTFLIGLTGYVATRYPKGTSTSGGPLLPPLVMAPLSRLTFTMLILPLIYEGIASNVKLESLESLYPIILASFGIIGISFLVTLTLGYLPCFRSNVKYSSNGGDDDMQKNRARARFTALCVASTFPNIVALPIIIFPTLCEYEVTHDLMDMDMDEDQDEASDVDSRIQQCITQTNAVIFTYFFGFSLIIWTLGQHTLVNLCQHYNGTGQGGENDQQANQLETNQLETSGDNDDSSSTTKRTIRTQRYRCMQYINKSTASILKATINIMKLPSFQVLVIAFLTTCIPPLQRAMFNPGGSMRALGSALEALAAAGSTFATIIVAATLGQPRQVEVTRINVTTEEEHQQQQQADIVAIFDKDQGKRGVVSTNRDGSSYVCEGGDCEEDKNEITDRSSNITNSDNELSQNAKSESSDMSERPKHRLWSRCMKSLWSIPMEDIKIYMWQISSRLFVTPAIVYLILIKLDCSGTLDGIPSIAKLVLLINSALPGALVVVVILKAEGLTDAAAAVSKTYLPTYVLSILTVAMWSSVGLMTWRNGSAICERF